MRCLVWYLHVPLLISVSLDLAVGSSMGGVAERAGKHDSGRSSRHLFSSLLGTLRVDNVDVCSRM